jgi:hypothetical protein
MSTPSSGEAPQKNITRQSFKNPCSGERRFRRILLKKKRKKKRDKNKDN